MPRLTQRQFDALARSRRWKLTAQRRAIVEFLGAVQHHPSVEEVFGAVNRRFPMTSRATVYNTLNLLRESGLVHELYKDGAIRFDPNLTPHHHFICRRCGKLEDIPWDMLPPLPLGELPGRQSVDAVEITLRGLCGACRTGR